MPDESIEPREHYVYALLREDGVTPFYIGMGKGDRWLHHEAACRLKDRSHKNAIIRQMLSRGVAVPKIKLAEQLTLTEARELEVKLIAQIGREPKGPLTNATDGGEGVFGLSPEKLAERGASLSETYKKRPELRARISELHRTRVRTPLSEAHKEKLKKANTGKKSAMSAEQRQKRADFFRNNAEKLKAARKAKAATDPDFVAKRHANISAAQKKFWSTNKDYMIARRARLRKPKPPKEPYSAERRREVQKNIWATRRQEILQKRAATLATKDQ